MTIRGVRCASFWHSISHLYCSVYRKYLNKLVPPKFLSFLFLSIFLTAWSSHISSIYRVVYNDIQKFQVLRARPTHGCFCPQWHNLILLFWSSLVIIWEGEGHMKYKDMKLWKVCEGPSEVSLGEPSLHTKASGPWTCSGGFWGAGPPGRRVP